MKRSRAAAQIGKPDQVGIVVTDMTRPDSADLIIAAALQRFGQFDVLVNNAGIFHTKPFAQYTVEE